MGLRAEVAAEKAELSVGERDRQEEHGWTRGLKTAGPEWLELEENQKVTLAKV